MKRMAGVEILYADIVIRCSLLQVSVRFGRREHLSYYFDGVRAQVRPNTTFLKIRAQGRYTLKGVKNREILHKK